VTAFDGAEGTLVPALLVAVTVNVYVVPLVRPSRCKWWPPWWCRYRRRGRRDGVPGDGEPPLSVGADHDTVDEAF